MKNKYARLSEEEFSLIKSLTKNGKSLRYISKLTGLGITTIYYNVRKFKPRRKKDFQISLSDFEIGELIGAFAGDGSYYHQPYDSQKSRSSHHKVRYHLSAISDEKYGAYLKKLLENMNLNVFAIKKPEVGKLDILVNSKDFIEFIKKYLRWDKNKTLSIRLRHNIYTYSDDFLKGFARGLMDTDGFMNSSNAVCACISKKLIENLAKVFEKFNIVISRTSVKRSNNWKELFYVRVLKAGLENYYKNIGFSNPYKQQRLTNILSRGKD